MPDSRILMGLGASTCASGNQPCSGNIGILTPKPSKKPSNTSTCSVLGMFCATCPIDTIKEPWCSKSYWLTANRLSNMNTEPPIVYNTKFRLAA
jgi:hypothetical protein